MAGIQDTNVIDLVTHEPSADEYVLIITAPEVWTDSDEQLRQLTDKINAYTTFAIEGGLVRAYPQTTGKSIRFQLDCWSPLTSRVGALVEHARYRLANFRIGFTVNLLS